MSMKKKDSFIQDRFTQGVVAGLIGWFPQFIFMIISSLFHWTKFTYAHFIAIIAFNSLPKGILQDIYVHFLVIALAAIFGGTFAMLIKILSSRNLRLKGAIYGGATWFGLYTLVDLYKMQGIYGKVDFPTSVVDLTGSTIYGFFMAWGLLILTRKFGVEN